MASYQVIAPLVQARKSDGSYVHVDEHGFLPEDIDEAQLEQLVASKMVVEADPPEVEESDGKPAGNASAEEWRAYALDHGHSEEDLADLSRNDIRDLFDQQ